MLIITHENIMLPPFEIRGLRWPTEDPESVTREGYIHDAWPEIKLETHEEYDNLIREHPETILSYLDEDDGDVITVSQTLFALLPLWLLYLPPGFNINSCLFRLVLRRNFTPVSRKCFPHKARLFLTCS